MNVSTCFWYPNNDAAEAAAFYVTLLPNSRVVEDGGIMVLWELNGVPFKGLNGGPVYQPSAAASIFVSVTTQDEIDGLWDKIVGNGGAVDSCGWCKDKYGISWQIVPDSLGQYLGGDDEAGRGRAMTAFRSMSKIDLAQLDKAYKGDI